jgi:ABC-2 type transport system permease protein
MFAVLKREYLQAVRRKMFIIMTFLFPFLMAGVMVLPGLMVAKGMGEKKIAVLDGTGTLRETFTRPNRPLEKTKDAKDQAREQLSGRRRGPELPSQLVVEYVDQKGVDVSTASKEYLPRLASEGPNRLDGVFLIPAGATDSPDTQLTYYSRSSTDVMTQERLARLTNKSVQRQRLAANGIRPDSVERLMSDMPIEAVQISKSGEQKTGGEGNFIVGFVFAALLILPSFIYGNETMRGIVQEKSERVVEVLVSSVTPMQLLMGKILGVAAVGLTQIGVWLLMGSLVGAYGAATAMVAGVNLSQFFRPIVFIYFFIFFILAYLTYVCVYAIAGAVSNTEREAQQFVAPISLVMMAPWFLMVPIIMNPDSRIAVGFSLAPVFGPVTMFVRTLVAEPPLWHIAVSVLVSIATIFALMWITAKIFRVGILSYGKRPTLPELWRWVKVA